MRLITRSFSTDTLELTCTVTQKYNDKSQCGSYCWAIVDFDGNVMAVGDCQAVARKEEVNEELAQDVLWQYVEESIP